MRSASVTALVICLEIKPNICDELFTTDSLPHPLSELGFGLLTLQGRYRGIGCLLDHVGKIWRLFARSRVHCTVHCSISQTIQNTLTQNYFSKRMDEVYQPRLRSKEKSGCKIV